MIIDIKLSKQNIVNDVAAELNLYGRTLELSANANDKAADNLKDLANYIRTPDDNESKPIIARSMQEAWNTVKETCQRFYVSGRYYDDNRLEAITLPSSIDGVLDIYTLYDSTFCFDLVSGTTYHFLFDFSGLVAGDAGNYCVYKDGTPIHTFELSSHTGKVEFDYLAVNSESPIFGIRPAADNSLTLSINDESDGGAYYKINFNQYGNYNLHLDMPSNFNISVTSSITSHAHRLIVDTIVAAVLKNQQQDGYAKYLTTAETARLALLRSLQARNSFGRVQHDWM